MSDLAAERMMRASSQMQEAAERMQRVQGWWDEMLRRHEQFLDDWLQRYEAAAERRQDG